MERRSGAPERLRLGFIGKLAKLTLDKNICSLIMNENKCSKGWVYP